jgi:hypothetical protein
MPAEPAEDSAVASLTVTSAPDPVAPPALAETLVWAQRFWKTWQLVALCTTVVVPFYRIGLYGLQDFLLPLLLHACGAHSHLRQTLREARPFAEVLTSIWARTTMPSQSQLSRWLARVDASAVVAFRTLFCPMSVRTV